MAALWTISLRSHFFKLWSWVVYWFRMRNIQRHPRLILLRVNFDFVWDSVEFVSTFGNP
jgi:hypothetical protein